MLRRFTRLVDPFASDRLDQPPHGLAAFYGRFVGQVWPWYAVTAVTSGLLAVIGAALFAYVGVVVDRIGLATDPATFMSDNLGLMVWIAFLVLVADPLLVFVHMAILNQGLTPSMTALVRWQTHRYMLRQSLAFFQGDFAGRLAQKVMQTSQALRRSVAEMIDAVWYVVVFWATAFGIMVDLDWRLGLPLFVWLIAYGATLWYFVPKVKSAAAETSEMNSRLTGRIVDSYTNIQTVKLFGHSRREDEYAREGISAYHRELGELNTWVSRFTFSTTMMNGLLLTAHGALALWLWSTADLSVGAVAASLGLIIRVTNMSHWIMFVASEIAENIGVVREGADIISKPHKVVDRPGAVDLVVERAEIRYDRIGFHYGETRDDDVKRVIHDLTLTVSPGEKVGLVGRSGAGKSTLVQLLLRFHDLQGGRILIDGQDIAAVRQESLRSAIGVVTQDTSLLHRSVMENIRYGRPEASLEEVIAAARKAQAHDFIEDLRDPGGRRGYEAQVGERGVKLSGGQRQRIAIARVLLKDAPILVLDEATSALDSEVEAAIQEQLFNLMAGKTVIAIAHRLSTIAAMDRLVVMDEGRIVEEGTHATLVQRGGVYARLWARQSHGFIVEPRPAPTADAA